MATPRQLRGAGMGYLGVGAAFIAMSATGQPAFAGVGFAFLGLALVFFAKGRSSP
jgi:hypothetical protein